MENRINIQSDSLTIKELFNNITYIIPEYQRPYSWGEDECEDLFDDIATAFANNKKNDKLYYLGNIIVYGNNSLSVIDGQQRLTTLSMLIKVLHINLQNNTDLEDCLFKVVKRNPTEELKIQSEDKEQQESLKKVLQSLTIKNITLSDKKNKTDGDIGNRYERAISILNNKLIEWLNDKKNKCDKFAEYLLDNVYVIRIVCPDKSQALTIFRTLNDRGKPLSDTDIFKSTLYGNLKNKIDKDKFIARWTKLKNLSTDDGEDSEDDKIGRLDNAFEIYRHFIRAEHGETNPTLSALRGDLLDSSKFNNPNEFIQTYEAIVYILDFIKNNYKNSNLNDKIKMYLQAINKFEISYIYPTIVMYIYYYYGFNKDIDKELIHKQDIIDKIRTEENVKDFTKFLRTYLKFLVSIVIADRKKPKVILYDVSMIYKKCIHTDKTQFISNINERIEFNRKKINSADVEINEMIEHNISNKKNHQFIFTTLSCLYKDEQEITEQENTEENPKPPKAVFVENLNIDHILPQKRIIDDTYWTEERHKQYINNIGNLISLESEINQKLKDDWFSKKIGIYRESRLIEVLDFAQKYDDVDKPDWKIEDIEQRKKELIKRVKDILGIKS